MSEVRPQDPRTPVFVITGFLGTGKTTLLRHLLDDPAFARSAVLVNEFGDVAIDDRLVRARAGELVTLESGCLCCSLRDGLASTLLDLDRRRRSGHVPALDRVMVETTGLADPAPILHALAADDALATRYRLAGVLVTVDAVNGWRQLDRQPEAVRQLAAADHILLTKTDLADRDSIEDLSERLRAINPGARLDTITHGVIDAGQVLSEATGGETGAGDPFAATHDHRHDPELDCFSLALEHPPSRDAFETWLSTLLAHRANDLLRIKGVIRFAGDEDAVLVNGVGGLLHPFEAAEPAWLAGGAGRLVFITRRMPAAMIRDSFGAVIGREAA